MAEAMTPPKKLQNAITSRLKIMASLDIAEKRRPQDGKFQVKVEGRQIDFRVSVLPTVHGEKVVCRILDSTNLGRHLMLAAPILAIGLPTLIVCGTSDLITPIAESRRRCFRQTSCGTLRLRRDAVSHFYRCRRFRVNRRRHSCALPAKRMIRCVVNR
jgi:pimeloyl-ACP methyl ester carboxylesterase